MSDTKRKRGRPQKTKAAEQGKGKGGEKPAGSRRSKDAPKVVIREPERCPNCKKPDQLRTYKTKQHAGFIARRRVCGICGHRFEERTFLTAN